MAINAATEWELRTAGDPENGGGWYDLDPGTSIDYSQQDAAQLSLADIATNGAGTGISSATGGFTAAMKGNILKIVDGTTPGWYHITVFTDTNNVTIDRSAGISQAGLTGNVGGAISTITDSFFENATVDGNTVHVKAGTYTLTGAISVSNSGASSNPISVIGYNATRGDEPKEDNRPLVSGGANTLWFTDYWNISCIRVTGTATKVFQVDSFTITRNCYAENTSGTAGRVALSAVVSTSTVATQVLDCSAVSTNGTAIELARNVLGHMLVAKDSNIGIRQTTSGDLIILKSIIADNNEGIDLGGKIASRVIGCTIDNNTTYGIDISPSGFNNIITNNVITNNGTGILAGAANNYVDFNNVWNNGTDYTGISAGDNDTSVDPVYVDAANGDYNISASMNTTRDFQFAETNETYNKGAVQSIGGGGGETAFGCVG